MWADVGKIWAGGARRSDAPYRVSNGGCGWKGRKEARIGIDGFHGLAKTGDLVVVITALAFVADLPVFDPIGFGMTVAHSLRPHGSIGRAIEVLDLFCG